MRNRAIDILKAWGIIFVIMGHTASVFSGWIYTFHMGLFFFVSGYLFYNKKLDTMFVFVRRKIKTLLLPYFLFWIVSMIISELENYNYCHSFFAITKNHIMGLLLGGHWLADNSINFPLWYFQLYFIASIFFYCIIRWIKGKWKILAFFILIVMTVPFQTIITGRPIFHINVLPAALVFMLFGYIFHEHEFALDSVKGTVVSIFVLIIGWKVSTTHYGNIAAIGSNIYYIEAFCTIIGLYFISKRMEGCILFQYFGERCLFILGLHSLFTSVAYNLSCYILNNFGMTNEFVINVGTVFFTMILCCGCYEIYFFLHGYFFKRKKTSNNRNSTK